MILLPDTNLHQKDMTLQLHHILRLILPSFVKVPCIHAFFLRLLFRTTFCVTSISVFSSSASRFTFLTSIVVSFSTIFGSEVLSSSTLTIVSSSSLTSFLATSLSAKALKSAVKSTECAHPASLPHRLRNLLPTASYVALVKLLCFPRPNL